MEAVNVPGQQEASAPVAIKASLEKPIEIESPSIEKLLKKANPFIRELFQQLREGIRTLDESISEKPTNTYIAYRVSKNFAEVHIHQDQIKIHIRPADYIDPELKVEEVPETHNWTLDRKISLKTQEGLDYVSNIIEQSYKNII